MIKPSITFVIFQGARLVRRETIRSGVIRIGRHRSNHLSLDDTGVAKRHAVIEVASATSITLVDLGGQGGLRLNGDWVDECPLAVGDRIELGGSVLLVEQIVMEEAEPRPSLPPPTALFTAPSTFAMQKSGPAVRPEEVELLHVMAAEVSIAWGDNVLMVTHLSPSQSFFVGDEEGPGRPCDFLIPREKLGAPRLPLILGGDAGLSVVIPPRAIGYVAGTDGVEVPLDAARARARSCPGLAGACELPLALGMRAVLQLGDIVFRVAAVRAGKPMAHGLSSGLDAAVLGYFALSALSLGGFLSSLAYLVPPLGMLDDEAEDEHRRYLMQQYLTSAAEREKERTVAEVVESGEPGGSAGARAQGAEGAMGRSDVAERQGRHAIAGTAARRDQQLSRHDARAEARTFGIIGLLDPSALGDPDAPTSPWGSELAVGSDALSAQGQIWGADPGAAYGTGGLAISGPGSGGGGKSQSIGLGDNGALGQLGPGGDGNRGLSRGHTTGSHRTSAPRLRMGDTQVTGRLPAEVIRRVVRQNHTRFRHCYEQGLMANPGLSGRVGVRFVIGADGAVANVANVGSDLPDPKVIGCVTRAFYDIGFPKPEGGIVTVVYPIMFQPD